MIQQIVLIVVLGLCIFGVLNPRLHTRTLGTLALSLIGILALIRLSAECPWLS